MRIAERLRRAWPSALSDAMGISGAGLTAFGVRLIYVPAGYIVGGVLLLAAAWLLARSK